jgi:hypothetical protein
MRRQDQHSKLPVDIERFTAGLVTNRDPLQTPFSVQALSVVPHLDALIDGLNMEITPRLTVARRPGFPVYCSAAASGTPLNLAGFRVPGGTHFALLDTTTNVYDFTASAMTSRLVKGTTAQGYFQQAGSQLFYANGTDAKKFDSSLSATGWGIVAPTAAPNVANVASAALPAWAANTFYNPSLSIEDSNNNIQLLTTPGTTNGVQPTWANTPGATTTDGTAVWTCQGQAARQINHVYAALAMIEVDFTTTYTYYTYDPGTHTLVPRTGTTNNSAFFQTTAGGTSSGTATGSITWAAGIGGQVTDGTVTWTNIGPKITWTTIGAAVLVSTNTYIVDSNGNQQTATKAGKSGGSAPTWSTTLNANTVDSGETWTFTATVSAANALAWQYVYVFKNSTTGHISAASPISTSIFLQAANNIAVSGDGSADSQVDKVDIYRTAQAGGVFYYLATVTNPGGGTAWNYTDANSDAVLNTELIVTTVPLNSPPPSGASLIAFYQGRLWVASGANLYFDGGGDIINGAPHESFPPANVFPYMSNVTALKATSQGLLVWTADEIHAILGGPQTLTYYSQTLKQGLGTLSQNAVTQDGDEIYFISSQGQGIIIAPDNEGEFGFNIADTLITNFPPATSYLAMHRSGSDTGVFVSDGSTSIQRFNQTSKAWNPKATPVGGCGPIASVETSAGVFALLTTIGGYVCQRSLTNWQDGQAAASYTAYATVGSLRFASMAEAPAAIRHIYTRTVNSGSVPVVGFLANSTSGTFLTVPFTATVPIGLSGTQFQSSTVIQRRYDLAAAVGIPLGAVSNAQIKFSFPAENFQNEITSIEIAGDTN